MKEKNVFLSSYLEYAKTIPAWTYWSFLVCTVAIYLALVAFQAAILTLVIPQEFTMQYLYLNVNSPNLTSMFFNHFMHNPLSASHLADNIQVFIFLVVLIFVAGFILLPKSECFLPTHFFPAIFFIYLLGLPFAISGISIWAGRIFEKTYVSGFSGIIFAMLGLFFFLLFLWFSCGILRNRPTNPLSPYVLLFSVFFVIAVAIAGIMLDLEDPGIGVFAHLGGFLLGLLSPAIVGIVLVSKSMKEKAGFTLLLVAVLAGCAGSWMLPV